MLLETLNNPLRGSATGFANDLDANLELLRGNDQGQQGRSEGTMDALFGRGVLAGTYEGALVSAGTGLEVVCAECAALIGFAVAPTEQVVSLAESALNTVWLLQTGVYVANVTGVNPGTADAPAIEIGTAATDASSVTAVADTADIIFPPKSPSNPGSYRYRVERFAASGGNQFTLMFAPVVEDATTTPATRRWRVEYMGVAQYEGDHFAVSPDGKTATFVTTPETGKPVVFSYEHEG